MAMDDPLTRPSAQRLQKPQVFVKVEFGVSWSAQHLPRRHGYEYKSRALRERNPDFPRHVPPPTTNYLATASIQPFQQGQLPHLPQDDHASHLQQQRSLPPTQNPSSSTFLSPEPYPSERGRSRHIEAIPEPPPLGPFPPTQRGESMASSLDRHERGSSAPPPLSENKWDVPAQETARLAAGSSIACAATQTRPFSNVWKDLPEVPSRFRLGEDGMPWEGTWTFPMGWEPFLDPDPYLRPSSTQTPPPSCQFRSPSPEQTFSPNFADIHSPAEQSSARPDESARRRELEALGSAMMTVDNGFENQWWNQGERGERRHLTAMHPPRATSEQAQEQMALGWVGALLPPSSSVDGNGERLSLDCMSPEDSVGPSLNNLVISPVSSYSGPVGNLARSLSTRSDELWFSGRCA